MMNLSQLGGRIGLMSDTSLFFSSILSSSSEPSKQREMLWPNHPDPRYPKMNSREASLYSSGDIYFIVLGEEKIREEIEKIDKLL
jgi:hypothetical protein